MHARYRRVIGSRLLIALGYVSLTVGIAPAGDGDHAFKSSCESIYGGDPIDFRHAAQTSSPSDADSASMKRTIDALLEASWLLIGDLPGATCGVHEKILAKAHGLELSSLSISDLRPLESMSRLEELTLSNNAISDLSPLRSLTKLKSLDVSGNRVSDMSPLHEMTTLVELRLLQNEVNDITALSSLSLLQELSLEANHVADVGPLASLASLRWVHLENNLITSIDSLSRLPKLAAVDANGNRITDITRFLPQPRPAGVFVGVDLSNNPISAEQLKDLVDRNGGTKLQPGQIVPFGVVFSHWTSPKYVVSGRYNGTEGFVNHKRTINICSVPNDPVRDFPHNWPTCEDHGHVAP